MRIDAASTAALKNSRRSSGRRLRSLATCERVSTLILDLAVSVKPLDGEAPEKADSADMCGNVDASFDRHVRYLVENNVGGVK